MPVRDDRVSLRKRIKEIAEARVRYDHRRIHVQLRRDGCAVNVKRIHQLFVWKALIYAPKGRSDAS